MYGSAPFVMMIDVVGGFICDEKGSEISRHHKHKQRQDVGRDGKASRIGRVVGWEAQSKVKEQATLYVLI